MVLLFRAITNVLIHREFFVVMLWLTFCSGKHGKENRYYGNNWVVRSVEFQTE